MEFKLIESIDLAIPGKFARLPFRNVILTYMNLLPYVQNTNPFSMMLYNMRSEYVETITLDVPNSFEINVGSINKTTFYIYFREIHRMFIVSRINDVFVSNELPAKKHNYVFACNGALWSKTQKSLNQIYPNDTIIVKCDFEEEEDILTSYANKFATTIGDVFTPRNI